MTIPTIRPVTTGDYAAVSEANRLAFGQDVHLQIVPLHTDDDGRPVETWAFG